MIVVGQSHGRAGVFAMYAHIWLCSEDTSGGVKMKVRRVARDAARLSRLSALPLVVIGVIHRLRSKVYHFQNQRTA